jgi:UDP-N-acetylmuramyl tripeptide synthase
MTDVTLERESAYFEDSRRLLGPNLFFDLPAAVLNGLGPAMHDAVAQTKWQSHALAMSEALGWPTPQFSTRPHANGVDLAVTAPLDQLFAATLVNEWAWETATQDRRPEVAVSNAIADIPNDIGDLVTASARIRSHALREANPALMALRAAGALQGAPVLADDEVVSIGHGQWSCVYPVTQTPPANTIEWSQHPPIPIALVTGSNGKTTTVRLIAAMLAEAGYSPGYSSTEGVVIGGEAQTRGDYSGPAGARQVLRDKRVTSAVLETARGGILRRGLAVTNANVAVVTNISADHFGEYGIDSLDDLARVKLSVARGLAENGALVLNGEDPALARFFEQYWPKVRLFAGVWLNASLQRKREEGGTICAVRDGNLVLCHAGGEASLGRVADMPLTVGGAASYNIANAAAAALAAHAMGCSGEGIAAVLSRFGARVTDNPGRLERWPVKGATVLIDYAHNPAGIAGLLAVAQALRPQRVGVLLGQAGNRTDDDIVELARTVATAKPDRIVVKELPAMLRGRALGEVPVRLVNALCEADQDRDTIVRIDDEATAARTLVEWAGAGDVIVLPLHAPTARESVRAWLQSLG